jgi:hypothetical protein
VSKIGSKGYVGPWLTDSTISFSLNGTGYSVVDHNCSGCVNHSVLEGFDDGANETVSWTQVDDLLNNSAASPEPGTLTLLAMEVLARVGSFRGKRSKARCR